MRTPTHRALRRLALLGLSLPLALAGAIAFENALLNLALPPLLNLRPERLAIDYTFAWTTVPGKVDVWNLRVRNQGAADQWLVRADRASGTIDLRALWDRRFLARDVGADGVSIRYRRRLDVDPPVVVDADARIETTLGPPIEGLENPPNPPPGPGKGVKWEVVLEGIDATDLNELWVGDYRLVGHASTVATARLVGAIADIEATLTIEEMQADLGESPVATSIHGEVGLLIDGLDRATLGDEKLHALSVRADVEADVQDLRFLDFYLSSVPWFSLQGIGHVDAHVVLEEGELLPGTHLAAEFPDLIARVTTNDITGDGTLVAMVETVDGASQGRLELEFADFAITPDGSTQALAEGHGFHGTFRSPDVRLDEPLTILDVELVLPESKIPSVSPYDAYLPRGVGLSLRSGTGLVRGKLSGSSVDGRAQGELIVTGNDVIVGMDQLRLTTDLSLHARLDADLLAGRYDVSGSTFQILRAGLVDEDDAQIEDGQRLWSAKIAIPSGSVRVGAPVYFDADLALTCSDSDPFVAVFASKKPLPQWTQQLLSVPHLSGEAHLQLGTDRLVIDRCSIRGGPASVDLRFERTEGSRHGDLYASYHGLALGIALRDDGSQLKLLGARAWFDGTAEATEEPRQTQKDRKLERRAERKRR